MPDAQTLRRETAVIASAALMATMIVAAPVLRAPSERLFGMETVGRHHDPFTMMAQFDRPIALGAYSQPVTDVSGALLSRAAGPVAAYNGVVLLSFPLSAIAAYLLARHLALSRSAAAIAAFGYAFSPFHLAHAAYHPHVAQTQWLPLYLLALWRCLDRATPLAVTLLGAATACVTLSNFYGGLIAAVLTPVAVAAYWLVTSRKREGSTRALATTLAALLLIAAAGAAYGWSVAHAVIADRAAFAFPRADLYRYGASWWSYLVPPVAHPFLGDASRQLFLASGAREAVLEQQLTLGWGVLALAVVAAGAWAVATGRDARAASPPRPISLPYVPLLVAIGAVAFLCSLPPESRIGPFTISAPSGALYAVAPMFRSYARFGVVVQLMAVLLAGIGIDRLRHTGAWRGRAARPALVGVVAVVAFVALAAAEYVVWPPALWRDVLPTDAHRWAARQPGPVRVLDCAPLTLATASVPWLTGDRIAPLSGAFDDCTEPNLSAKLSAGGYTHLLVRRGTPERQWFARPAARDGLQPQTRFRDAEVFAVTARPPAVYTAEMTAFSPREHDEGRTWRWMGPDASWRIVNRSARPVVAAVDIEMSAFHRARRLDLVLDRRPVQTLVVQQQRGTYRIAPLTLAPGEHQLVFHPAEAPTFEDDVMKTGDARPLSFAIGTWNWALQEVR